MVKRKLSTNTILVISFFIFFSKLLGLLRESITAAIFGASIETDIYYFSLNLNQVIVVIIGSAISTSLIAILSNIDNEKLSIRFINNIRVLFILISIIIVIVGTFISSPLINLLGYGYDDSQKLLAKKFFIMGLPICIFVFQSSILSGYLNHLNRFIVSSMTGIPFNICFITYLMFFSKDFGIFGLTLVTVIAYASQFLFQLPSLFASGYRYSAISFRNDKHIAMFYRQILPISIGVMLVELNVLIDKSMATSLTAGSISYLNFASRINTLALTIFVSAVTTFIYPKISSQAIINREQFIRTISNSIDLISLITIIFSVFVLLFSKEIVNILFLRGAFTENDSDITSRILMIYALALPFLGQRELISRAFYAERNTKVPMLNSIISVIVNLSVNIILIKPFGIYGLATGTTVSSIIGTVMLFIQLCKSLKTYIPSENINFGLKIGLITLLNAILIAVLKNYIVIVSDIVRIIFFLVIYFVIFIILSIPTKIFPKLKQIVKHL